MIQNFGGGEILAIIVLALVLLGPDRLPEMARNAGKAIHKLKTMAGGLQGQVQGLMDDPAMQPLKELGEFAARPRQKLAEYALEAEAEERAKAEATSLDAAEADTTVEEPTAVDTTDGADRPAHLDTTDGADGPAHLDTTDGADRPAHLDTTDGADRPAHLDTTGTAPDGAAVPSADTTAVDRPHLHAVGDATEPAPAADGTKPAEERESA